MKQPEKLEDLTPNKQLEIKEPPPPSSGQLMNEMFAGLRDGYLVHIIIKGHEQVIVVPIDNFTRNKLTESIKKTSRFIKKGGLFNGDGSLKAEAFLPPTQGNQGQIRLRPISERSRGPKTTGGKPEEVRSDSSSNNNGEQRTGNGGTETSSVPPKQSRSSVRVHKRVDRPGPSGTGDRREHNKESNDSSGGSQSSSGSPQDEGNKIRES